MLQGNEEVLARTVSSIEADRQKKKTYFLVFIILAVVAFAAVLVLLFSGLATLDMPLLITCGVLAVVAFVFLTLGLSFRGKFAKAAVRVLDDLVDKTYYTDVAKYPKSGFDLPELLSTGFFSAPDRYLRSDLKIGKCNGLSFAQASYNLQRREVRRNGKNTYVEYVTYAAGTLYRIDFGRHFDHEVRVIEKAGLFGGGFYNGEKVETEFIAFNNKFNTYSNDKQTVFYLLTPQVQEKIMALEGFLKGTFDLAFASGNRLYIAVNDGGQSLGLSIMKPFDKSKAEHVLRVLSFPVLAIDELNLTSAKFQPNAGTAAQAGQ